VKYTTDRQFADPEMAARKLLEIANSVEAIQDGRIHIEKINGPFLFKEGGSPAEYGAGLALAVASGWLWLHESGTSVKLHRAARSCSPDCRQPDTVVTSVRLERGRQLRRPFVFGDLASGLLRLSQWPVLRWRLQTWIAWGKAHKLDFGLGEIPHHVRRPRLFGLRHHQALTLRGAELLRLT
jgi:hypothetical protein